MATLTHSPVTLVEAAEDRRLFGLTVSERQRELLVLIEAKHTTVANCGRQSGKTLCCAVAATANLLLRPDLDEAAGGSARYVISIANSKEQASILLGFVREFCERSPLLRQRLVQQRDDRIVFEGGRVLIAVPCQDRLTRGLRASLIVMDEAGHFVSDTYGPRTAERIWGALRPSLVTFGEAGKALVVSTPGESEFFTRLHAQATAGELPGAAGFSATTLAMNPRVSAEFLEAERVVLGESDFAREYLGEATGGTGNFFDEDLVRAVVGRYSELPASEGAGWLVGFDASFSSDPSAAAVVGRSKESREQLLVARVERWQPRRTRKQRRAAKSASAKQEVQDLVLDGVARLSADYGDCPVVADQHLSEVVREGLRSRGVAQVVVQRWSGATVTQAFRALRARMLADKISLPNDKDLVGELLRIRSRVRSGQAAVEVPRTTTSHCDLAMALGAAVLRLETKGMPARARVFSSFNGAPRRRVGGPLGIEPGEEERAYGVYSANTIGQSIEMPVHSPAAIGATAMAGGHWRGVVFIADTHDQKEEPCP